jgi:seryl-tRNA(Sec) selenium transferase
MTFFFCGKSSGLTAGRKESVERLRSQVTK